MLYNSTRGGEKAITASMAILKGLSSDGGLFLPEEIPLLEKSFDEIKDMSYQETAFEVMKKFLTDFTEEELKFCIESAYDSKFDTAEIAPVVKKDDVYFLELFHGRTIAFKDMALSILPYLSTVSARKNGVKEKIVILTATSGDTGKAAMEGFQDVEGTEIIVFFPYGGVSGFQELQMRTQKGKNTHVCAIKGNFDDAQTGVKNIFGDEEYKACLKEKGIILSSANSINIGRLIPQVAYYVYAYGQLLKKGFIENGQKINITVPTGNFGNILAAFIAKKMGLPVNKLICASNDNRVLTDFFESGNYDRRRPFILTESPSMDILISSNLERLIYLSSGNDAEKVRSLMEKLKNEGIYSVNDEMKAYMKDFLGYSANGKEVRKAIKETFERSGYVIDPHTAVAKASYDKYRKETGDETKTLIASTASPFKFSQAVMESIGEDPGDEDIFSIIERLSKLSGIPLPDAVKDLKNAEIRHSSVAEKDKLKETVSGFLDL